MPGRRLVLTRAGLEAGWRALETIMQSLAAEGLPGLGLLSDKEPVCQFKRCKFDPWVRKIPWRRAWQPTPVFLLGDSHGQKSLVGCSPWGRPEGDR